MPTEAFCRNRSSGDGRAYYCRPCHAQQQRDTRERLYGGSYRHYKLRLKYGIGAAEVDAMVARQGGVCAICEERPAVQVDHDHKTGKVRGILCDGCNGGLGAFGEDLDLMERAAKYLKFHGNAVSG
jgi:hypothetical protein